MIDRGTHNLVESLPVGINAAKPNAAVLLVYYEIHLSVVVTASDDGTVSVRQADPNYTPNVSVLCHSRTMLMPPSGARFLRRPFFAFS